MEKLFERTKIGAMELKNRIVMAPMGTNTANKDGTVSQHVIDFYVRMAQGGVGLINAEAAEIHPKPNGPFINLLNISDDKYIPGLSALVRAIKANGARVSLQLWHPGRQASFFYQSFESVMVAPSAIAAPHSTIVRGALTIDESWDRNRKQQDSVSGYPVPRELTTEEIGVLVERFAQAARRTKEAGFDAVEVHGAHSYLMCQFLSPLSNRRNDRYGGDTRRRTRFALEVIAAVRKQVGPDYPIIVRLSADEHLDGGLTIDETKVIAPLLEEAGVDAISVSAGGGALNEWTAQPMLLPRGCLVPLSEEIKKVVHVPVMVAGRINDPKLAETILQEGKADLIAMGRPLLADPDLPKKALEGRSDDIRKCMACGFCTGGGSIGCVLNPETGKEGQIEAKAPKARSVLILGAGPAGLEAARVARVRGHQVTLWHDSKILGGRWSWLIRPFINERVKDLKDLGVSLEFGNSFDPDRVARMKPDAVIATAGKTPLIPEISGVDQDNVLQADDVIEEKAKAGGRVVILGAGSIGCEAAEFLCRKGAKKVTIIESAGEIANGLNVATGTVMTRRLRERGVEFFTNSKVLRIEGDKVYFKDARDQEHSVQADNVVLASGSKPDNTFVDQLKGRGFDLYPVNYCQNQMDLCPSIIEGASVARKI